jgi:hypothetical protein
MRAQRARWVAAGSVVSLLLVAAASWAQAPLTATLSPSGLVSVAAGETEPVTIELSAHGPNWKHAPQEAATATTGDLPGEAGRRVTGTLPVPDTEGGALEYRETVRPLAEGLRLEYEVNVVRTMTLFGLQVSIYLPVPRYGGLELLVTSPDEDPQTVALPAERSDETFQLWAGQGARVEVAKGTERAVTLELLGPTDVIVQDLRQWDQEVYEIRFPAIMEGGGREVTPEDRFHLDLSATFAGPLTLAAPEAGPAPTGQAAPLGLQGHP